MASRSGVILLSAWFWLWAANADAQVLAEPFPLAQTVAQMRQTLANSHIVPTGQTGEDYLKVAGGIVDYFHHFQAADGRIIDPFAHREVQYSTPCYAWAAAALVASGRHPRLLPSASLALDCALQQLAQAKPADNHGDFFTFPAMLAYENLRDRVSAEQRGQWEGLLRKIDPYKSYRDIRIDQPDGVHNWNIVALSGEFLRCQDGFTGTKFLEDSLAAQMHNFTAAGMYVDPHAPMAYDLFPRHFLAAIVERGYQGQFSQRLAQLLDRGAWTSLLLQSPRGELPTGGRSAQHQWNEAMQCVTYEIWAKRAQRAGDIVAARAFKRAARLALESVRRWVRPSGELYIVKNRFDPALRHGFQGYSFHSQYNLLAASMLASAWLMADDSIDEGPCPADAGGFALFLPEFHKVIANAGGLYVELDTGADPAYNPTGLLRVHKTGIETLVGPSDGSLSNRLEMLAAGIGWQDNGDWRSLAALGAKEITNLDFEATKQEPKEVRFKVRYHLQNQLPSAILEEYLLTPQSLRVTAEAQGSVPAIRVRFPAFVFDGREPSRLLLQGPGALLVRAGGQQTFTVVWPQGAQLQRGGQWIESRNGYLEEVFADLPGNRVIYTLEPQE